jgi:hypothetical protein
LPTLVGLTYCDEYTQDEIIERCDFRRDHVVGMQILVLTSITHQKQPNNIQQPQEDQVLNKDVADTEHHTPDSSKSFPTMLKLISGTLVGGAN